MKPLQSVTRDQSSSLNRCLRFLSIFILLFFTGTSTHGAAPQRVLLISSYHPAFPTFFEQANGIRDVFNPLSIELDIEFLDSKRFSYEETAPKMFSLLKTKMSKLPPYQAIMAADDNSLRFILQYQQELFAETPVVFFGINNIQLALQQNENVFITGVVEAVSMKETISTICSLQPELKSITAIVDSTTSGRSDLQTYYQAAIFFPDIAFSELSLTKLSWGDFKEALKQRKEHEALLLLSAYRDKDSISLSFGESLKIITQNSPVPVYHLWYHGLGQGIVGGKVISQYEQGKTAAEMVNRILSGTPASQIRVTENSPNKYIFDYPLLKKYGISTKLLPKNSILLNQPSSFWRENKEITLLTAFAFLILTTGLLFSLYILYLKRQNERQLKASEDKYRTLIEGTSDAVVSIDAHKIIRSWNAGAAKMYGYSEEEIVGSHISRLLPQTQLEENYRIIDRVFSNGDYQGFETENLTKEGKKITVDISFNRQTNQADEIYGISGFIRNISDRRAAENALQESEEKFSSAFRNAPVLMAISTVESNTLLEVNDALLTATGYDLDKLIGKSVDETGLIPEDEFAKLKELFRNQGQVHNREITLIKADGTKLPCLYSGEILNMGDSSKVLAIATDLTERKNLERDLLQAQKMEAIGTLAGGIAHDFNNILAAIIGYTELALQSCPPDSDITEDLREVLEAGNRAKGLVQQILAFSRQGDSEKILIQPASLIKENLKMLRPSLPATIDIVQYITPHTGTIFIDPTHLNQIVLNLCTNAYHAMEKHGGTLTVILEPQDVDGKSCIHLGICDTGIGITPEIQKRIFEPYFTTKETGKGTGMGLSIVHGLVTGYNGKLTVESNPGQGTCVHIYLPVINQKTEETEQPLLNEPTGSEHILFVDDEEMLVNMGKTMLTRLGYRVTSATSSIEALELFNHNPDQFDLVITDQTMPTMTGIELTDKLLSIRPDLPVILCTGFSSIVSEKEAESIGIKQFTLKPLSRKKLAVMIRNALEN